MIRSTYVYLSKRLEAACSCPVGHRCKHGVAVILQFLDTFENGTPVPEADDNDRRLTLIENGWDELSDDEFDDEEERVTYQLVDSDDIERLAI